MLLLLRLRWRRQVAGGLAAGRAVPAAAVQRQAAAGQRRQARPRRRKGEAPDTHAAMVRRLTWQAQQQVHNACVRLVADSFGVWLRAGAGGGDVGQGAARVCQVAGGAAARCGGGRQARRQPGLRARRAAKDGGRGALGLHEAGAAHARGARREAKGALAAATAGSAARTPPCGAAPTHFVVPCAPTLNRARRRRRRAGRSRRPRAPRAGPRRRPSPRTPREGPRGAPATAPTCQRGTSWWRTRPWRPRTSSR